MDGNSIKGWTTEIQIQLSYWAKAIIRRKKKENLYDLDHQIPSNIKITWYWHMGKANRPRNKAVQKNTDT
jgi:hypothetical protein